MNRRKLATDQESQLRSALGPAPESHSRPEAVVLRTRRHGRRLTLPVLCAVGIAGATGFWGGRFPEFWMNLLVWGGAVAATILFVLLPLFSWLATRTTITTRRVIMRRGLFVHQRSETSLQRVREVRSRRGLVQRMFGSGNIDLLVGAEAVQMRDVPGVEFITEALQELMERNYAMTMGQTRVQSLDGTWEQMVNSGRAPGNGGLGGPASPSASSFAPAATTRL